MLAAAIVLLTAGAGPLSSATLLTVGIETAVGQATGLPTAWMLPVALEGLGAVALVYLLAIRPQGGMRAWCVLLIAASLGAGMAAQGSHALWFDEQHKRLVLPWGVKLFVSFVPPMSGAASLHLMAQMAERVLGTLRDLTAARAEDRAQAVRTAEAIQAAHDAQPSPPRPRAQAVRTGNAQGKAAADAQTVRKAPRKRAAQPVRTTLRGNGAKAARILRADPRAGWREVKEATGLSDAAARRLVTDVRKQMGNLAVVDEAGAQENA
jgi:hypothetical protein